MPKLDGQGAEDEQPEHDHQRQIKPAERCRQEQRKGEEHRAAGGDQPDLIAIPNRADRAYHLLAFLLAPGDQQVEDADAEIEPIQHHVSGEHPGQKDEPNGLHVRLLQPVP